MFCPYCGTKLVENASFCVNCGKKIVSSADNREQLPVNHNVIDPQVQQYQAQKNAARKSEIDSLTTAIVYFSQKASQFKEYDYVCDRVNYYARGAKSALLIWGCIITSFALTIAIPLMSTNDPDAWILSLFWVPGILMIIGGILMKVNNRSKLAHFKERYAQLSKELYNHYITCPNCPVGSEYANPEILRLLLNVLQSGRADTVKESINLMIDARHQARVREYLATIQRNTAEINATTKVATFFAAASIFV